MTKPVATKPSMSVVIVRGATCRASASTRWVHGPRRASSHNTCARDSVRPLRARPSLAVRLSFHGTHSGEFLGLPATGRSIEYVGHEFYRVAGGVIAEEWICSDMATLMRQIS